MTQQNPELNPERKSHFALSLVIPCYNEDAVIALTHQALVDSLGSDPTFDLEIVYVDDGSRDDTNNILLGIASTDQRVRVIFLSRNFGHQAAVTAGLEHANGDVVIIMDADLQDPPEVVFDMLEKWREGFEIVYGVREKRKESPLHRLFYLMFYRIFRRLSDIEMPLDSGDFALLDRRVVDVLNDLPEKNRFIRGLRVWTGFSQCGVPYERAARAAGKTKYPLSKLFKLAFDGILNFSTVPLTLISLAGVFTAVIALLGFAFFFANKILGRAIFGLSFGDIPGFTTLILTLLFLGGLQLISIGVLGEYLGRIYQEVKRRPVYVVRDIYERKGKDPANAPTDPEKQPDGK